MSSINGEALKNYLDGTIGNIEFNLSQNVGKPWPYADSREYTEGRLAGLREVRATLGP